MQIARARVVNVRARACRRSLMFARKAMHTHAHMHAGGRAALRAALGSNACRYVLRCAESSQSCMRTWARWTLLRSYGSRCCSTPTALRCAHNRCLSFSVHGMPIPSHS
eukprot:6204219-Pleurochrysis_carterae.AAC.1